VTALAETGPGQTANTEVDYGHGAVDRYDLAAELEAQGFNERLSRVHLGGQTLFEIGDILVTRRPVRERHGRPRAAVVRADLHEALLRALTLVAGVALAACFFRAMGSCPVTIVVAGVGGWVGGQVSTAILWRRRGIGDRDGGVRVAGVCGALLVAAASLGALLGVPWCPGALVPWCPGALVPWWPGGWATVAVVAFLQVYAQAVGVLAGASRLAPACGCVVGGALSAAAALQVGAPSAVVAGVCVTAVLAIGVLAVAESWQAPLIWPVSRDWSVVPAAVVQAGILALGVVSLLGASGAGGAGAFVVSSILAIALTDPALVYFRYRFQTLAASGTSWRGLALHVQTRALAVCISAAGGACAVSAVMGERSLSALALVGSYVAIASASSSLRSFGASWLAVVAAVPVLVAGVAQLFAGPSVASLVAAVGVVGGLSLVAIVVRDPRCYL
jgi:hypothetical protein